MTEDSRHLQRTEQNTRHILSHFRDLTSVCYRTNSQTIGRGRGPSNQIRFFPKCDNAQTKKTRRLNLRWPPFVNNRSMMMKELTAASGQAGCREFLQGMHGEVE